jgi:hypothetical protein
LWWKPSFKNFITDIITWSMISWTSWPQRDTELSGHEKFALGNHCKGACTSWLKEYTFLLLMTYILWKNYMIVCLVYLSEFIDSEGREKVRI